MDVNIVLYLLYANSSCDKDVSVDNVVTVALLAET